MALGRRGRRLGILRSVQIMALGSQDERSDHGAAPHPLAPLKRAEQDWAGVYRMYCDLPPREHEVLDMLVGRREPKQIAQELRVSRATVRNQIANIKRKFAVNTLQELVSLVIVALFEEARRSGSLEVDGESARS